MKEVHRAPTTWASASGSLVNVFGPQIVIIGGGVTEALGAPWVDLVRDSIRKAVLVDPHESIKVEAAMLGDDAGRARCGACWPPSDSLQGMGRIFTPLTRKRRVIRCSENPCSPNIGTFFPIGKSTRHRLCHTMGVVQLS